MSDLQITVSTLSLLVLCVLYRINNGQWSGWYYFAGFAGVTSGCAAGVALFVYKWNSFWLMLLWKQAFFLICILLVVILISLELVELAKKMYKRLTKKDKS
jgi:tetrahydromethanopterin S-methyltransferase subunit E